MLRPIAHGTSQFARMVDMLREANLPTSDLGEGSAEYVSLDEGSAFGGLARHGDVGLLRSVVVPQDQRGQGTGSALLAALIDRARDGGIRDLWLLTTGAESFFARHGFTRMERTQAPSVVANTSQFRDLCPRSAALMRKHIP